MMTTNLTRRDPFDAAAALLHPQSLDEFLSDLMGKRLRPEGYPPAMIQRVGDELVVQLTLAGHPKENLSVEASGNTLRIRGEKVEDEESLFATRAFKWERRDPTNTWDFNNATVQYKDGLLTVRVPQRKELKPKELKIS